MIITDQFVLLNFPKTGSSFARAMLKEVHGYDFWPRRLARRLGQPDGSGMVEILLPTIGRKIVHRQTQNQHGTYRQIPHQHRQKTIVTIIRNTFERYVSGYLYGFWRKKFLSIVPSEELSRNYPSFPDLSFPEYYALIHQYGLENKLNNATPKSEIGNHTAHFIQFYFPDPEIVFNKIEKGYLKKQRYLAEMPEIVFLHQECLNEELFDFLKQCGYPIEKIDFIRRAAPLNVTPRNKEQHHLQEFYTPELVDKILVRDQLLFDLFPEYRPGAPLCEL